MTTTTDNGLDYLRDRAIGDASGPIDTIVVGTGSGSESQTASSVDSNVYTGVSSDSNIEFEPVSQTGRLEAIITVKGGTEVPADTNITEMAIRASSDGVLVSIDNFDAVPVEGGHTEEFTMPVQVQR